MGNEEQKNQSGGRNSVSVKCRDLKQKKFPQRGLGVAQLEKMMMEEHKRGEGLLATNVSSGNFSGDSAVPQCLNSSHLSPPSTNFPSPNPLNISSPGGLQAASGGNWPRLWEYDCLEGDIERLENPGYGFNLPYESSSVPQRSYQVQGHPSYSMQMQMNSPSSMFSQMEPPSNQILHGNWLEAHNMRRCFPRLNNRPPAYKSRFQELPSCSGRRDDRDTAKKDNPVDFLAMAPPSPAFQPSNSKQKEPLVFESMANQENDRGKGTHRGVSRMPEGTYEFFPPKPEFGQSASSSGKGEEDENMDLTLRL